MKKRILVVLSIALTLSANLRAQVTIGELAEPAKGALLDLNKAVKGGLALSNVDLPDFHTIPNGFPAIASQANVTTSVKTGFKGALVYNTGVTSPPAGIYVWNGTNWTPVKENCTPLTAANLTLTGLPFAKVGADVTFAISTGASAFCSQGESYRWYKTGADNSTYTLIPDETASSLTTSFSPAGTYKVKVEVTNRYTVAPLEKEATVIIIADGVPPAPYLDANYAVTGDFCYDVKGPKPSSQTQAFYDSRTDGFAGGLTKTYTFTYTNDFSDLTVLNPGGIVASVTQPAVTSGSGSGSVTFEVTFVSDVKSRVLTNNGPIQVELLVSYISYKNNVGDTKVAYKNIKVQDAVCGCPAKISATQWLTFQCHNLGADYDIRSDADLANINATNFWEYHGDWYRWGAKTVSLVNTGTNDGAQGWTTTMPDYQEPSEDDTSQKDVDGNNLWKAENNPCPSGWRLPTATEWATVIDVSNNAQKHYVDGVAIIGSTGWDLDDINNVLKLGDYLYLPAAGARDKSSGQLTYRGHSGYYWSSSENGSVGLNMDFKHDAPFMGIQVRPYGLSVRCVLAE
ncbi:MAG: hypothetical protein LBP72_10410 [Dysgonamonadaceae bacterium]|jgi:uncharacterized protein (TIGR02145 family)|nr:hypothetical protein [Dysgonamonadaceae bacterium]